MILNLTQHPASAEQRAASVVDLTGEERDRLTAALTFEDLPSREEITRRAVDVADLAASILIGPGLGLQADSSEPVYRRSTAADHDRAAMHRKVGDLSAMIGGAPYLMSALEEALDTQGIGAVYAFSVRESTEQTAPDGSVRKVNVFRHAGFVPAV
jgi:hypothetical protein